jgi:predicted transcriptional regulator of viral defense system
MDELLIGSMIRTLLVGGEHAVVIVMLEGVDFNPSGILVVCMMVVKAFRRLFFNMYKVMKQTANMQQITAMELTTISTSRTVIALVDIVDDPRLLSITLFVGACDKLNVIEDL